MQAAQCEIPKLEMTQNTENTVGKKKNDEGKKKNKKKKTSHGMNN